MKHCELGDSAVYEQLARIGKAISSPTRLQLLHLLCHGERTVQVLAEQAGMSVANASQHLQVLSQARLVEAEKHGLYVTYRIADERVGAFLLALREVAEARLAELEQIARGLLEESGAEPMTAAELADRLRAGDVVLIDLRPAEEFRAGHIPGAISVPYTELEARLATLPADRAIVAYCRGPYCVTAAEAVRALRAGGRDAVRLAPSVPEWRALGLPVEVEPEGAAQRG